MPFTLGEKKAGGGVGIFVDNEIKHCTAPHINSRNLEIIWISITRKNLRPLFVGVYYGKQESEGTKADIEAEIGQLTEEILEIQQEVLIKGINLFKEIGRKIYQRRV